MTIAQLMTALYPASVLAWGSFFLWLLVKFKSLTLKSREILLAALKESEARVKMASEIEKLRSQAAREIPVEKIPDTEADPEAWTEFRADLLKFGTGKIMMSDMVEKWRGREIPERPKRLREAEQQVLRQESLADNERRRTKERKDDQDRWQLRIDEREAEAKLRERESQGDSVFSMINTIAKEFSKGLEKIVDLKKMENIGEAEEPTFRPNQWVRRKADGRLAQATAGAGYSAGGPSFLEAVDEQGFHQTADDRYETARPLAGEWWHWKRCEGRHSHYDSFVGAEQWKGNAKDMSNADDVRERVECGCLEPVNWGRGERSA